MTGTAETPRLQIVRRFDVPPEKVSDTLTRPNDMRVWWGEGATFDIDLRAGGRWIITRVADGTEYVATGEYLVVERPRRLSYTYVMPPFSSNTDTISWEIVADGGGSVLTFVQAGPDITSELREVPQGAVSASEQGWQQGLVLMAAAWAKTAEPGVTADRRGTEQTIALDLTGGSGP